MFTRIIKVCSQVFHEDYMSVFTRVIGSQVFHEGYKSVFMSISRGIYECFTRIRSVFTRVIEDF